MVKLVARKNVPLLYALFMAFSLYTAPVASVEKLDIKMDETCNYYGIYPSSYQTASRALSQSIKNTYNLDQFATIFELKSDRISGATFRHQDGNGALTAIGLTRIPDIRIAALGLLMYYQPSIYRTNFGESGMSRFVTLQLGQQGGA